MKCRFKQVETTINMKDKDMPITHKNHIAKW